MTRPTKLEDIQKTLTLITDRLENHSHFVIKDILPQLEVLQRQVAKLWISEDRFTELERAVADIAGVVYQRRTGKPADSRVRKH